MFTLGPFGEHYLHAVQDGSERSGATDVEPFDRATCNLGLGSLRLELRAHAGKNVCERRSFSFLWEALCTSACGHWTSVRFDLIPFDLLLNDTSFSLPFKCFTLYSSPSLSFLCLPLPRPFSLSSLTLAVRPDRTRGPPRERPSYRGAPPLQGPHPLHAQRRQPKACCQNDVFALCKEPIP